MIENANMEDIILRRIDLDRNLTDDEVLELIDKELQKESRTHGWSIRERDKIRQNIYNDIRELGLLKDLLDDPDITEIMVNGIDGIFVEKKGKLSLVEENFQTREKLKKVIWQIAADCNRSVNDASPIVDARLLDGSRVNIVLDPVALNGPILTIRRFPKSPITLDDLLRMKSINEECSSFLKEAVVKGMNVIVSGGTGSGKTTFLNVLSGFIPESQRVITIEDSAELQLQGLPNLVRLETRNSNVEGCNEITIRDLLKTSLRMRPDRIIVGEVRSKETVDMLQSINVGHSAMTTVHANSVKDVVSRLETMVLMGMEMPIPAIRGQIASGFDLMVHLGRCEDGSRSLFEVSEPIGIEEGDVIINPLFKLTSEGIKRVGEVQREKWKNAF